MEQINVSQRKSGNFPQYRYTDNERLLALSVYAETQNFQAASDATGIPSSTIEYWIGSEQGEAMLQDIRTSLRHSVAFDVAKAAMLAVKLAHQRLIEGDAVVMRDGSIVYKPVSARDCSTISSIMIDKWTLLTGTNQTGSSESSRLNSLAKQLEQAINDVKTVATQGQSQPIEENQGTVGGNLDAEKSA